jgi:RND family efflux transporter MFP subunit
MALAGLLLALLAVSAGCSSDADAEGEGDAHAPVAEAGHAEGEGKEHGDEHGDEHAAGEGGNRVTLTEPAFATARIEVTPAAADAGGAGGGGVEIPGQVDFDPARVALVSPRVGGRIERLAAVPGDRVGAGQAVAYITSPAALSAQNDLVLAARRAELLAGTQDAEGARALVAAARRRLQLLGVSRAAMDRLAAGGQPSPVIAVPAPFAGSVIESLALPGAAVEPGTPIFKIADLSTVNVAADVPERALPSLRVGQTATVRLAAYPDFRAAGRVERVGDVVDPSTRTVKALVRVPNPARTLRPGMFASVALDLPAGMGGGGAAPVRVAVTVPESALVTDGDTRYVFVEVGARTYERRAVEIAPGAPAGRVGVLSGIQPGERVVTRGAFTLKSELGKAGFGGHDH